MNASPSAAPSTELPLVHEDAASALPPIRPTLSELFTAFATISLSGFGGVLAWARRMMVDKRRWLTAEQFNETYALAQLTPGPNVIIVTLIGYHVAGIAGALVTTLAMCGPTCLFAFFVGRLSDRFRGSTWHLTLSRALVPVTLGLTAASATVVATAADYTWTAAAMSLVTAIVAFWVRISPLWIFAAAALFGLFGAF